MRLWRRIRDTLAAAFDERYQVYRRRCRRHNVPPMPHREYVQLVQDFEVNEQDRDNDGPRYEGYCRRCRRHGIDPLSYDEYCRLKPKFDPIPSNCPRCDYNLTGNVSGRCPECGRYLQ
jgi:hypothetical protein